MAKDYKKIAAEILRNVGGEENVAHLEHCSTRLRFTLADSGKADVEALKKINGVMGVVMTAQCQVIIGNDVIEVYDALQEIASFGGGRPAPEGGGEKRGAGAAVLDFVVGVFQPLIPAIAGGGILKALLSLLTLTGVMDSASAIYQVLYQAADATLYFLPLMVAVTTANKLKCNRLIALAVVGTLILPNVTTLISEGAALFGFQIQSIQYTYQVFPAILCVMFLALVEKYVTKFSPKPIRVFFVPMVCIILVVPVTLLVLGPLGFNLGQLLTKVILFLYSKLGWIAVALLAAILPFMIAMGMHKALVPYAVSSITEMGEELLYMPASLAHNISESGACFAVAVRTKDTDLRSAAVSAGISALFGITEPALYGVTLTRRRVLAGVMAGSFVSGLIVGLAGLKAFVAMGPGLAGMAMFVDPANSMNIVYSFIGLGAALAVSFAATLLLYREEENSLPGEAAQSGRGGARTAGDEPRAIAVGERVSLASPLEGELVSLADVKDDVFRQGILGDGVAILPEKGELYAPADGTIAMVTDSKHAVSMETAEGVELLIHVGMDTVKLEGRGFQAMVKAGDAVKKGQLLLKFDLEAVRKAGYDLSTPVVVTNGDRFAVSTSGAGHVQVGDEIAEVEAIV